MRRLKIYIQRNGDGAGIRPGMRKVSWNGKKFVEYPSLSVFTVNVRIANKRRGRVFVFYHQSNTAQLPMPNNPREIEDDRYKPNNRKPNTTKAIGEYGLPGKGISD